MRGYLSVMISLPGGMSQGSLEPGVFCFNSGGVVSAVLAGL